MHTKLARAGSISGALLFALCSAGCSSSSEPTASAHDVDAQSNDGPSSDAPSNDASSVENTDTGTPDSGNSVVDASLPSIDPTLHAQNLTSAQRGELCDWYNAELGGYGTSYDCGGLTVKTNLDQATCVAEIFTPSCTMTVAQFEACVESKVPSHGCSMDYSICRPLHACINGQ